MSDINWKRVQLLAEKGWTIAEIAEDQYRPSYSKGYIGRREARALAERQALLNACKAHIKKTRRGSYKATMRFLNQRPDKWISEAMDSLSADEVNRMAMRYFG